MQESRNIRANILHSFQLIWTEFGILLRLVGVMNLIFIASRQFSIHGRKPNCCNFVKNHFNVGSNSDIYRSISFKLGAMVGTTKLNILMPFWMTLITIQGHSFIKIENFGVHFLRFISLFDLDEIQYVATTCWSVEVPATFMLCKEYARERTLLT